MSMIFVMLALIAMAFPRLRPMIAPLLLMLGLVLLWVAVSVAVGAIFFALTTEQRHGGTATMAETECTTQLKPYGTPALIDVCCRRGYAMFGATAGYQFEPGFGICNGVVERQEAAIATKRVRELQRDLDLIERENTK